MNSEKSFKNQENFQLARDIARKKLKDMDLADVAQRAGGTFRKEGTDEGVIQIDYLGKPVHITAPVMTLTCDKDDWKERGGPIKLREEIFILHYLIRASGIHPKGNFIPFRRMDGGITYDSVFRARSVGRLLSAFRDREECLRDIGGIFGGTPGDLGNVSVRLMVLPHVELSLVLWKGDDEIPPSGNIIFDESVMDYLPTEDCVVMAETVVSRIICVLN